MGFQRYRIIREDRHKTQRWTAKGPKRGFVTALETDAKRNRDFRHVLYTAKHSQLVLMRLGPGEEIGDEIHRGVDQFLRIEEGEGVATINGVPHRIRDGTGILVPAGARHNIANASRERDLVLYTVYAPPEHRDQIIHSTKAEAIASQEHFDGQTTE